MDIQESWVNTAIKECLYDIVKMERLHNQEIIKLAIKKANSQI